MLCPRVCWGDANEMEEGRGVVCLQGVDICLPAWNFRLCTLGVGRYKFELGGLASGVLPPPTREISKYVSVFSEILGVTELIPSRSAATIF